MLISQFISTHRILLSLTQQQLMHQAIDIRMTVRHVFEYGALMFHQYCRGLLASVPPRLAFAIVCLEYTSLILAIVDIESALVAVQEGK